MQFSTSVAAELHNNRPAGICKWAYLMREAVIFSFAPVECLTPPEFGHNMYLPLQHCRWHPIHYCCASGTKSTSHFLLSLKAVHFLNKCDPVEICTEKRHLYLDTPPSNCSQCKDHLYAMHCILLTWRLEYDNHYGQLPVSIRNL